MAAENPTGSAFGADLTRSGGAAVASYLIFGVPAQLPSSPYYQQWYVTPERAVIAHLTQFGSKPMSCDRPAELFAGSGYMGMACQSEALKGLVAYKVFGMADSGYVVLVRTAGSLHAMWSRDGVEATAVARSVQCQVPFAAEPVEVRYAFSAQEGEERPGRTRFRVQPLAWDGALSRYDNRRELLG